jgi:hypothetical protein
VLSLRWQISYFTYFLLLIYTIVLWQQTALPLVQKTPLSTLGSSWAWAQNKVVVQATRLKLLDRPKKRIKKGRKTIEKLVSIELPSSNRSRPKRMNWSRLPGFKLSQSPGQA